MIYHTFWGRSPSSLFQELRGFSKKARAFSNFGRGGLRCWLMGLAKLAHGFSKIGLSIGPDLVPDLDHIWSHAWAIFVPRIGTHLVPDSDHIWCHTLA